MGIERCSVPAWVFFCLSAGWLILLGAPAREAVAAEKSVDLTVFGPKGLPVRDAVIGLYPVDESAEQAAASDGTEAIMDQRALRFDPHVLAIQKGTEVDFPNSDQVRHSIYSFSSVRVFEVKLYKGSDAPPILFDKPGLAVLGCNIHDSMLSFVYVLETPHFGVSNEAGIVSISNVPSGRYRIQVHHPRLDETVAYESELTLPGSNPIRVPLSKTPPPREDELEDRGRDGGGDSDSGIDGLFGWRR